MGEIQLTEDTVTGRRDRTGEVSGCSGSAESAGHAALSAKNRRAPDGSRPREDPEQLRVMIVDDDADVLKPVKAIFDYFGYRVTTAGGSAEAMADLSVKQFDLVVTDFEMPGMNGFRLAMWLKAESPATRVVIMTGRGRTEIPRSMTSGSVDGWIFKPFGVGDLRNVLDWLGFPHPSCCAT